MASRKYSTKSDTWKYFDLSNDKKKTVCRLCSIQLVYSSGTSSMRNHILHKHKSVSISSKTSPGAVQRQVSVPVPEYHISKQSLSKPPKHEKLNKAVAIMCGTDLLPTSIVEGSGFQYFVKLLNPDYKLPSRPTVMTYLEQIYEETKLNLIPQLAGQVVSLTTDLWTSLNNRGYITLTGHYIDDEWILHAKVLATRPVDEQHTGVYIAYHIASLETEFTFGKISALVTDDTSNMVVAARDANIVHVICFVHTVQLAINEGLKVPGIAKAIAVCQSLVAHFSYSTLASSSLHDHQVKMGMEPLQLQQDVIPEWNSSYMMMSRILTLRASICAVIFDDNITNASDCATLGLKDNIWKIMENVVPTLAPLIEAMELLAQEDQPTCSGVYVLLRSLLSGLRVDEDMDSGVIKDIKIKISEELQIRFLVDEDGQPNDEILTEPCVLAMALDPRFKSLKFLSPSKRDVVHQYLINMIDNQDEVVVASQSQSAAVAIKVEQGTTNPFKCRLIDALKGDVVDLRNASRSSELELDSYVSAAVNISEPLTWWKNQCYTFPRLAKLARFYLAIPATKVSGAKEFSGAGHTVTNLRASLDPQNVDQAIFLHKNFTTKSLLKKEVTKQSQPEEPASTSAQAGTIN